MRFDIRVAMVLAALAEACGGSTAVEGAGADGGSEAAGPDGGNAGNPEGASPESGGDTSDQGAARVPVNHRPSDAQCGTPAPPGNCSVAVNNFGDAGCLNDNDCASGTNGRCINGSGGPAICSCTVDACIQDSDCPLGQTCACHGSPYAFTQGNTCLQGDCRVDADCGPQGYCSPSISATSCGRLVGYYCHTGADLCTDDSDCESQSGRACVHSSSPARWECQAQTYQDCPV
jgi:hypothetical protein